MIKKIWHRLIKLLVSEKEIRKAKKDDSFVMPLAFIFYLVICIFADYNLFVGKNAFFSYFTYYNTKAPTEGVIEDYGDKVKKTYYYDYKENNYHCEVISESSKLDKYIYFNKKDPANCVERHIYSGTIDIFTDAAVIIALLICLILFLVFHIMIVYYFILSYYTISAKFFKKT